MRKWLTFVLTSFFLLVGCASEPTSNVLRVGTIAGPETELMETAQRVAKNRYGLDMKIIQFTDYTMPNAALAEKSIDANMFQTIPYFDADVKARNFDLAIIGKTFIYPMALYSNKYKNLQDIPQKSQVAIPNDASNEARALLLLQKAGLVVLNPGARNLVTILDVKENPKQLDIRPLDAAQLPRVLPDVALAAINTNYAVPAGLLPTRDGIFIEDKNSPYANVLVVRAADKDDPRFQLLMKALQSPEVIEKARQLFLEQAIPAWSLAGSPLRRTEEG